MQIFKRSIYQNCRRVEKNHDYWQRPGGNVDFDMNVPHVRTDSNISLLLLSQQAATLANVCVAVLTAQAYLSDSQCTLWASSQRWARAFLSACCRPSSALPTAWQKITNRMSLSPSSCVIKDILHDNRSWEGSAQSPDVVEKVKCFLMMKGRISRSSATVLVGSNGWSFLTAAGYAVSTLPVCVWAYGRVFVWLSHALHYNTWEAAERCNRRGSALFSSVFFSDFVKLNPSKFHDENKWKAADLRVMLKSHNKVIIQSKHWSCTDS